MNFYKNETKTIKTNQHRQIQLNRIALEIIHNFLRKLQVLINSQLQKEPTNKFGFIIFHKLSKLI